MQNPRRPPAEQRRASGARDRPVSFNRRLEEAREARARVLAAREGQKGDDPSVPEPGAAETTGPRGASRRDEAAPSHEDEGPERRRSPIPWRIAGGFLAGAASGAVAIWVLLPWGQPPSPGAQSGTTPAPEVASALPEAPSDDPAQASAAGPEPAPAEVAADDGEGGAEEESVTATLPEVTAADRARGARRQVVTDADDGAADRADPATEAAGPTRAEAASGTLSVTEVASRIDGGSATSSSGESSVPSDEEGAEPQGAAPLPEAAVGERIDGNGEAAGTPDAAEVEAAAEGGGEQAAAAGATDAEPASEEVSPRPDPPPAEELGRGSDEDEPAVVDVSELATAAAPSVGEDAATPEVADLAGRLYVHAAPGVTSEELDDVVTRLSDAGYAVEESRRVDFRISQTNVRYFHGEDAELSAGVAETVSGVSRDFTDYDPAPDPGTIEVWLEG